ncbi:CamS family sex pheromone protein [Sporolactobacillus spathodeae]|uniref:Protein involved in sex pheromone biosynthesis n=1 Tax=Sporolactobacillus spathodeae TaxID=1465502 RepID=A0ABS2Q706_9BACL|nr:CamS family sex pheromone protein [Sporolactobacillus spathodeae]MBM7657572.1 protein involved in sex pheromone biosynthesis [Sporolactobacillus spathodeae]
MKQRRSSALLAGFLSLSVLLAGCSFGGSQTSKVVNKKNGKTETTSLIPATSNKGYQSIKPQANDQMRGYINYGVDNRVDIDQLEGGLVNLSKSVYSPSSYVFQSGQYLSTNDIDHILYRKGQEQNETGRFKGVPGLNPPLGKGNVVTQAQKHPKYLNYVLEQDYLKKQGGKYVLGGVSIAVSLNSVYSDRIMDKNKNINPVEVTLNQSQVKAWGKAVAPKILSRIRQVNGLSQVPILLTLYMTSAPSSLVPGDFYAQTEVSASSSTISSWKNISDHHVLFPSSTASSNYKADLDKFNLFKDDVQKYFPNFVGVVGKGYYHNGNLSDLQLDVNIQFTDETEVTSFANYVASIVNNRFGFARDIPVHIYITSDSTQEALIERTSSSDNAYVSIYEH